MEPTSFDESNSYMSAPDGVSDEDCTPLSVFQGIAQLPSGDACPICISCWKLTKEELEQIKTTGRVWLWVYGGGMPPVALTTDKPPMPTEDKDG
jgi:hypothetical protein